MMPMSIEEVEGEDGSQTHRIKADLDQIDKSKELESENLKLTSQKKQLIFAKALSLLVNEFDNKAAEALQEKPEASSG